VRPENAPRLLTDLPTRLELLAETGLDATVVLAFDQARAHESEEQRFREKHGEHAQHGVFRFPGQRVRAQKQILVGARAQRLQAGVDARDMQTAGKTGSVFKAVTHGVMAFLRTYVVRLGFLDEQPATGCEPRHDATQDCQAVVEMHQLRPRPKG
jgi:hypothetical protein